MPKLNHTEGAMYDIVEETDVFHTIGPDFSFDLGAVVEAYVDQAHFATRVESLACICRVDLCHI